MKAKTKKYISVTIMVLVAALNIPQLSGFIPMDVKTFSLGTIGIGTISAIGLLISAWWVGNKEVD